MLTRWLTFTAFLVASANPARAAVTVAPTSRVKGHPEAELSLNCGDRKNAGVVQYWHTPFGDLQTPGFRSKLDPVYMHDDGSLVVPKVSSLHSGLYYCLQQHTEGTTLWPYKLHVGHFPQNNQERSKNEKCSSCDAFRFKREVESGAQRQRGFSAGLFKAAIIASVLLTFVLGFGAGALSGNCIRRCLGLQSPRRQQGKTDMPDHGHGVTRTTMMPRHDNQAFVMEHVKNDSSAKRVTRNSSASSSPPPPPKPQRSLRVKQQEEQDNTAYLEGCDYVRGGEGRIEEVAGRRLDDGSKGCDEETEEGKEFHLLDDGGSQTDTNEDRSSDEGRERDGRSQKKGWRQEKEVKEAHGQKNKSEEGRKESEAKERGSQKKGRVDKREEEERREERERDDGVTKRGGDTSSEGDETGSQSQEDTEKRSPSPSRQGRRSRVIRLYQYDDDGQRYCHLPDPAPDEPGPAPRHQQRSISMTRLNTIMAAASAGPLDTTTDTGREERSRFHMDI